MGPPIRQANATETADFLVRIAEPTRRGGVGGIAIAQYFRLAGGACGSQPLEHGLCLSRRKRVGQIAPIDEFDDLGGRKTAEQLPERFAFKFRPEVPESVDHGGGGEVHHPFLGSDPAQLTVAHQTLAKRAGRTDEVHDPLPHHKRL